MGVGRSPLSEQQHYEITGRLGRGKYSLVFEGVDVRNKQKVAIKALKPIRKERIKREFFMLSSLSHANIAQLRDVVRDPLTKTASFVLELAPSEDFKLAFPKFSYEDIRNYTRELFRTLDYLHSSGVMHRDVKPQNVLFDRQHKSFKLIDFSLAELYYPEREYSTRVSSLYYKAPELLLGNVFYDYRVDVWSAGVILAGLVALPPLRSSRPRPSSRATTTWTSWPRSPRCWAPARSRCTARSTRTSCWSARR